MTWEDGTVTGGENHAWLVSSSDFRGDPDEFERAISAFIGDAARRRRRTPRVRLAYVGVPGILTDLYDFLEEAGAAVVFNETQRQFSMPFPRQDLVGQYLSYTYPYGLSARIEDIDREVRLRHVDGIVHYVQSFCFRNIHDYQLRRSVAVPVLTLEGDRPGPLDARSKLRLESFVEMLAERGVS
jgi:benzoyl-CoA reductase/2-hydroxyglutaryl-CoA dehydratase subunit BcrC/BadD/HgdB